MYVSVWLISKEQEFSVKEILPNAYTVAIAAVALGIPSDLTYFSSMRAYSQQYGILGELVGAGAVAMVVVTAVALLERKFFIECWRRLR